MSNFPFKAMPWRISEADVESAACGCPECNQSVQPGHFACSTVSEEFLFMERQRVIVRFYEGPSWRWAVNWEVVGDGFSDSGDLDRDLDRDLDQLAAELKAEFGAHWGLKR